MQAKMKTLCINIDNGAEWELAQSEFNRVGLTVERFPAIVEDNRVLAFNKSVYFCMKLAEGQELFLFEDDVIFDGHQTSQFFHGLMQTPDDYLTLHLGCNIIGTDTMVWQMPTAYSPHLAKLHNCFQSHATLYSAECVRYILDNFKYVTDEYKTEGCIIFDEWLRLNVLNQGRSYIMKPMIAYQRPRKSSIWGGDTIQDYTSCHIRGNEYLSKL